VCSAPSVNNLPGTYSETGGDLNDRDKKRSRTTTNLTDSWLFAMASPTMALTWSWGQEEVRDGRD